MLPTRFEKKQSGMSMVSLMVGMLLAMIGILAAMTLYQNMVRTSIETRTDAALDGQLASAMLSLQLELQSAGFGLTAGVTPHIVRVVTAAPGATQSLYWRFQATGAANPTCRGFRIEDSQGDSIRQLQILQPTNPAIACTAVVALEAINWSILATVGEFRKSEAANADLPDIGITMVDQSCFPYGMGQAAVHKLVTITADNAARRAARKAGTANPNDAFVYSLCLPNL